MSAKIFVDTNIWLYSLIQTANDSRHGQAADFLLGLARPVISSQGPEGVFPAAKVDEMVKVLDEITHRAAA